MDKRSKAKTLWSLEKSLYTVTTKHYQCDPIHLQTGLKPGKLLQLHQSSVGSVDFSWQQMNPGV